METIAALRRRADWTQMELASRLGVTVTTVASWEQGKYDPNARQLRELCRVFAVGVDYVILPSDRNPPGRPRKPPAE